MLRLEQERSISRLNKLGKMSSIICSMSVTNSVSIITTIQQLLSSSTATMPSSVLNHSNKCPFKAKTTTSPVLTFETSATNRLDDASTIVGEEDSVFKEAGVNASQATPAQIAQYLLKDTMSTMH